MPISITVSDLVTRAAQRAYVDVTGTGGPVTTTEVIGLTNTHYRRLYQKLARKAPWRFVTDTTITTVASTINYALPSDYLFSIAVYANEESDLRRPLKNLNDTDRVCYRSPQGVYAVTHRYVPTPSALTTTSNTIDGVCGLDEWVVVNVARDIRIKTQLAFDDLTFELQELNQDILDVAGRDLGMPEMATDVETVDRWPYPYRQAIDAYQIIGTNLALYSSSPVFP